MAGAKPNGDWVLYQNPDRHRVIGRPTSECTPWRDEAANMLQLRGHGAADPMLRDYRGRELDPMVTREIVEGDKYVIDYVDALVVNYDRPSTGTSMEVLYAHQRGIPVITINAQAREERRPLSPWLVYHSSTVVESVAEAIDAVEDLCL